MELNLLLPVLASIQIIPSLASPEAPTLSLHPPHLEFFEGERLTLRCSAPVAEEPMGYQFFNQGNGLQISDVPPDPYTEGRLHLTAQLAVSGIYSCAYWKVGSGQKTTSKKSLPISIQVKAAPPAPALFLNPLQETYHIKDSVGLVCMAPPPVSGIKGFLYFGDVGIGVVAVESSKNNYMYNLSITGPTVLGSYSCSYWVRLSGRKVQAKRSASVTIILGTSWTRELAVGGLFFTINGLIFLITYYLMKHEGSQWSHRKVIQAPSRTSKSLQHQSSQPPCDPQSQVNISLLPDSVSQTDKEGS